MNLRYSPSFLLLCVLLLATSCISDEEIFERHKTVFELGDEPEWASKDLNDQQWKSRIRLVPDGKVYWSRTPIDIMKAPETFDPYGLRLHIYGEYEVFWDGELIGKNGNPGQEELFGPEGKMWAIFSIPSHLTEAGEHLLAIRSSLFYFSNHTGIDELEIDYYDDLLTDRLIETSFMHLFAGAFLIASIYFLFLFLGNKREYSTLIFSISCFLLFTLILAEFVKAYVPIHYSLHVIRLQIIGILMLGISFLVPLYFSMQFPFPKRKWLLILYAGVLLFIFLARYDYFELTANNMVRCMSVFSFGIVAFGVYNKQKGALLVMSTLLLSVLIGFVMPFNKSLFAGFSLILLGMFYLLSLRIKEQRLAYENSLVQSTRLKLELLKKNIQPHFLMNTLTSLIDWVEEAPKKGVQFIEALAKEFDLINQMEDQALIPIEQEIALCKTHLEIMQYRKEIDYSWEEEGIDPGQKIPPAVLHTLMENGITHSLPSDDKRIRFRLIYESNGGFRSYTFLTFAKVLEKAQSKEDGTGLKYIKARLTESYQSKWDFHSEPADHGWKSIIKLYH